MLKAEKLRKNQLNLILGEVIKLHYTQYVNFTKTTLPHSLLNALIGFLVYGGEKNDDEVNTLKAHVSKVNSTLDAILSFLNKNEL